MFAYIHNSIPGRVFRPAEPLTEANCDILGELAEDYERGLFVPLTDEQAAWADAHPHAKASEILTMTEDATEALERARALKLHDIDCFDSSMAINGFTVNGVELWFTPLERANYKQSVESAKLLGVEKLSFFAGDVLLNVSTAEAERMLAMIQLYADSCYIVTRQHRKAVESLETVAEVENYDYTVNYPEKLNFEISQLCF